MKQQAKLFFLLVLVGLMVYFALNPSQLQKLLLVPPLVPRYSLSAMSELKAKQQVNAGQTATHRVVHSTPTPLPPPADEQIRSLRHAFDSDDVCEYVRLSPLAAILSESIFERTTSPGIQSLFGKEGPLQGNQAYYSDQVTRFYNALLYADLIDGIHFNAKDEQIALQLLSSLTQEYRDNGVFPYYYAYILSLTGRDIAEQKRWLLLALEAPYFDSFMKEKVDEVSKELTQNATLWMAVNQVLSTVPFPRVPGLAFVRSVFSEPTVEEARILSEFAVRINRSAVSLKIEALVAKKIYDFYRRKALLAEADPPLVGLTVLARDPESPTEEVTDEDAFAALVRKPCDRSRFDEQFERLKRDQKLTPDF